METQTKVILGVVTAVGVGAAIYFGFIRDTGTKIDKGSSGGVGSAPAGAPPVASPKPKTKVEDAIKKVACNKAFPPPRTKKDKIEAYKKCMLGADGYTWSNCDGCGGKC